MTRSFSLSVSFLRRARGDLPIPSSTWQVKIMSDVRDNRLTPRIPTLCSREHAQFVNMFKVDDTSDVIFLMRDEGCGNLPSAHAP